MQRIIPSLLWFAAGALVAGALGRRAIDRLMYTATEISLGWYVLPRVDIADLILLAVLGLATLPFVLRRRDPQPWRTRAALAVGLGLLWFLPGLEEEMGRFGRRMWGPYGDRVATGLEFFVIIGAGAFAAGWTGRLAGAGLAVVAAAVALEAFVPHSTLLFAAFVAAPLTLFVRSPTADE